MRVCLTLGLGLLALSHSGVLSAKCGMRPYEGADGKQHPFATVIPEGEAKEYAGRGFQEISCATIDKDASHKAVCEMARTGNSAVQNIGG